MRITILLIVLSSALTLHSQKFYVNFNHNFHFSQGQTLNYNDLIQKGGFRIDAGKNGENRYVIDLTNRELQLYFEGSFIRKISIKKSSIEGDLVKFEFDDYDMNDGSNLPVYCVFNKGNDFSKYPYFIFYYRSGDHVEGYIVFEK